MQRNDLRFALENNFTDATELSTRTCVGDVTSRRSLSRHSAMSAPIFFQGPLLLTWFNFNPSMEK